MKALVIGGTGLVGSHVVHALAARGAKVRVLTRSVEKAASMPAGAEAALGDLNEPYGGVREAFVGMDAVFMLNPVSQTEANQGICGVALAREAEVRRLVYMSVHRADVAPYLPHFGSKLGVEAAVKASGAAWTILRPSNFFQNDEWLQRPILEHGVYTQPIGDVGVHRVDVRDIADAAVNALTSSAFERRTFALVGPEPLTGAACARVLASKLARPVRYAGDDLDAWAHAMSAFLPDVALFDFRMMFAHFQEHGLLATAAERAGCEAIVGHPSRTYDAYASDLARRWLAATAPQPHA